MSVSDSSRSSSGRPAFPLLQFVPHAAVLAALLAVMVPPLVRAYHSRQQSSAGEQLFAAVFAEDVEAAAAALKAGADPNARNSEDRTAMSIAIGKNSAPLVELLLDAGAEYYAAGALSVAVRTQQLPLARRLLEDGTDPNSGDLLPLHWSAQHGDIDAMELLLEFGADMEKPGRNMGNSTGTPLWAAATGDQPVEVRLHAVQFLLERGADPDNGAGGHTAMDHAVFRSDAPLADLLRRYGAAYGAREAVALNRLNEVQRLLDENPGLLEIRCRPFPPFTKSPPGQEPTLLGVALHSGHAEMVRLLIEQGAPLETVEHCGQTPLHLAARYSSPQLVQLLIERGLDVNARNEKQFTPLIESIWKPSHDVIALLIEAGADVNARGYVDNTALLLAVQYDWLDAARLLLASGADPTINGTHDNTALHLAVRNSSPHLVQLLIERGLDVNARNEMQHTPLIDCMQYRAPLEVIALLIESGADVNARGNNDRTALLMAVEADRLDVARLLAAAGADPTIPDFRGYTAVGVIQKRNLSWTSFLESSPD